MQIYLFFCKKYRFRDEKWWKIKKQASKNTKNTQLWRKKVQKNITDIQICYEKRLEKSEKKFGRIKKVRTFAIANEVKDTPWKKMRESFEITETEDSVFVF